MKLRGLLSLLFVTWIHCSVVTAEQGVLQLQVLDTQNEPLRGVVVVPSGAGGPGLPTDSTGRTRIQLPPQTQQANIVELDIASPRNKFIFISPWDQRLIVPSFENQPQNFVRITLGTPGDRNLLSNDMAVRAMASKIARLLSTNAAHELTPESKSAALRQVALTFGMTDSEIDSSIRNWGTKVQDSYDKGIAAFYAGNYSQAQQQLQIAADNNRADLEQRIKRQADTEFFLAQSCYLQGKYQKAADALRETLKWRPDDPLVLNNLALNLAQVGNLKESETLYRRAMDLQNAASIHDDFLLSQSIGSLGGVLLRENKVSEAEPLLREALTIRRQAMSADDPRIATSMNNLAVLLQIEGKFDEAEDLLKKALEIQKLAAQRPPICLSSPADSSSGVSANCASLISETQRGLTPQPSQTAMSQTAMSQSAAISPPTANYAMTAPRQFGGSVDISEKGLVGLSGLAQQQPGIASTMCNLAMLYVVRNRDLNTAESLVRNALEAQSRILPEEHPDFATSYEALGTVLAAKNDNPAAKQAFQKALEIRMLNFGPDHIYLVEIYESLAHLEVTADPSAAANNLGNALRIETKNWGDTDTRTQSTKMELLNIARNQEHQAQQ